MTTQAEIQTDVQTVTARARWDGEHRFTTHTGSGHTLTLDGLPAPGGTSAGPSPVELLLAGVAGCSGIDVVDILRKMRQDVTAYEVEAHGDRATTHPRVYTQVRVEHRLWGRNLDPAKVQRALDLSREKYCSVAAMLAWGAEVVFTYRLMD